MLIHTDSSTVLPYFCNISIRHGLAVGLVRAVLLIPLFITPSTASANPNHRDVHVGMAVHGEQAKVLQARIHGLYDEALKSTQRIIEMTAKGDLAKVNPQLFISARVPAGQGARLSEQLRLLGEPAGPDYELRCNRLLQVSGPPLNQYITFPTSQKYIDGLRQKLAKQAPARANVVGRLEQLIQQQKWEAAEKMLDDALVLIYTDTTFFHSSETAVILKPFEQVTAAIRTAMLNKRRQIAAQLLAERRQKLAFDLPGLVQQVSAAADSIGATGTFDPDGQPLSGPQTLTMLAGRWDEAHASAIRVMAIDWARHANGYDSAAGYDAAAAYDPSLVGEVAAPATSDSASPLSQEYAKFTAAMIGGIVRLIDADAQRLPAAEIESRHAEYLAALSPISGQLADRQALSAFSAALDRLAAKSPALGLQVKYYGEATNELLRWRQRAAEAMARAATGDARPIEQQMYDATVSRPPDYTGLFPQVNADRRYPALLASSPQILEPALPNLVGQTITASDVTRLAGNSKYAIARYQLRTYVNTPAPMDTAGQVAELKADLFVAESQPPLTLAAAAAIHSAERGDFDAVGGEIVGAHLEGVITRFASLPTAAAWMLPLDRLPDEWPQQPSLNQVLMRFDVQPTWVQHRCFFQRIGPPANAQAAHNGGAQRVQ
ncbi:MAG: hypothetical protein R3C99_16710 [Pirellulaceae bacterium]